MSRARQHASFLQSTNTNDAEQKTAQKSMLEEFRDGGIRTRATVAVVGAVGSKDTDGGTRIRAILAVLRASIISYRAEVLQ